MLAAHAIEMFTLFRAARDGNWTLRETIAQIEKDARKINDEEDCNKFKGDALEILSEIFFNAFSNDPSVGLVEYSPVNIENDYGVDAIGRNAAGNQVAVQVKYRSNPKELVTYEEMAKTDCSARRHFGIDTIHPDTIYLVTTAIGVTTSCQDVLGRSLKVIGIDILGDYIRNNHNFWEYAYREVYDYLNQQKPS